MDYLKMDINILVSILNTKLRDFYNSLTELCEDLNIDEVKLNERLTEFNFEYDPKTKQIK